jgi:S-adenosylmethionine-diacylglycerol 3-amino-3-carboxypropyl transferase
MVVERLSKTWFNLVHGRNIVYNQCWEDPRLDRVALELTPQDRVVVITSAGCNALDYALAGAGHVHAVDMNPKQNHLLELKLAGLRNLDYDTFWNLFGKGCLLDWNSVYVHQLRPHLQADARRYWDRKGSLFKRGRRKSFYFRCTSGTFAWFVNYYVDRVAKMRDAVNALLAAENVEQQRSLFEQYDLAKKLWKPMIKFAMRRDVTLSLLGVPRAQRKQIDEQYPGGILQFVVDRVESVFTKIPLKDNYAWRVYLTGEYSHDACPEYLKRDNFDRLKQGVADQVTTHTNTVQGFLESHDQPVSRLVLLDHMDWLSRDPAKKILTAEWQAILDKTTPSARVLWRSAGLDGTFINPIQVVVNGQKRKLEEILHYNRELANELHVKDRVHTYGSFCIADIRR